MNPVKNLCLPFLCAALLASCSPSLKVTTDYDKAANFSAYKTFNFYNLKTTGSVSQLNVDRIIAAIKANLVSKGFTETTSNPDLMVNAVTIFKEKQTTTATTNYYGYGGMYRPYGYYGGMGGTGYTSVNTYDYIDGSLVIDIVDAKTNNMIWEGTGNKDIDKAPKDPDKAVKTAVTSIMAGFPPGAKK